MVYLSKSCTIHLYPHNKFIQLSFGYFKFKHFQTYLCTLYACMSLLTALKFVTHVKQYLTIRIFPILILLDKCSLFLPYLSFKTICQKINVTEDQSSHFKFNAFHFMTIINTNSNKFTVANLVLF